jgi:hypothetical protein
MHDNTAAREQLGWFYVRNLVARIKQKRGVSSEMNHDAPGQLGDRRRPLVDVRLIVLLVPSPRCQAGSAQG